VYLRHLIVRFVVTTKIIGFLPQEPPC